MYGKLPDTSISPRISSNILWKKYAQWDYEKEQKENIEQKTNEILFRISPQGEDSWGPTGWRRQLKKSVEIPGGNSVEALGETGVLKDAIGLGLLLLLIASTQMASFVFG